MKPTSKPFPGGSGKHTSSHKRIMAAALDLAITIWSEFEAGHEGQVAAQPAGEYHALAR